MAQPGSRLLKEKQHKRCAGFKSSVGTPAAERYRVRGMLGVVEVKSRTLGGSCVPATLRCRAEGSASLQRREGKRPMQNGQPNSLQSKRGARKEKTPAGKYRTDPHLQSLPRGNNPAKFALLVWKKKRAVVTPFLY